MLSILKVKINGLLSFIIKRKLGPFNKLLVENREREASSIEKIETYQLKKLNEILSHSQKSIPYYRDFFEGHKDILPLTSLDELSKVPSLSKKDIIPIRNAFVSKKYPKIFTRSAYTGGTTGTPFLLTRDIHSINCEHAFVKRQWEWAGIELSDSCAFLSGLVFIDVNEKDGNKYVYNNFMKELYLSTYHLNDECVYQFVEAIKKYNIKALVGYPSAIHTFALLCEKYELVLNIKSILTTSEVLLPSMKEKITQVLSCPVFDFYGSAERACYIFTCKEGNYHLQEDYGFTELLPDATLGENHYRLLSTGFWNKAMPFIRYDLGDVVVVSGKACSCGCNFRVVDKIIGRNGDLIKTPDGKVYGSAILTHILYGAKNIKESQIIQEDLSHIAIHYVPSVGFCSKDLDLFRNLVYKHISSELEVAFVQENELEKSNRGKFRPVISRI